MRALAETIVTRLARELNLNPSTVEVLQLADVVVDILREDAELQRRRSEERLRFNYLVD